MRTSQSAGESHLGASSPGAGASQALACGEAALTMRVCSASGSDGERASEVARSRRRQHPLGVSHRDPRKVKMKSTTTIEPWKEASPKILQLWKDRHPAYQSFSSHYMASQRRMLFLADVNPSERFEAFETICFKRNLSPTTAETYWSTWLGIQKALIIKPSDADHRITKILKARSMAYPVQFPTPITLSEMDLLVSTFDASQPSLAAIAMTTFLLGQRISDMIQLAVADLKSNDDYLTITVRRGKTMQVTTPYSLWLRRKTYPTETLIELAASAKSCGRLFLFTNLNSEEERQRVSHTVRDMLTSINDQLELRSLRRGGLQRMAHLGVSIPTMLHFSRHSDVPMLMRYVSWGQHATQLQNQIAFHASVHGSRRRLPLENAGSQACCPASRGKSRRFARTLPGGCKQSRRIRPQCS
jgi:integrase